MQKIKKIQDLTVLNSPEETDYFVGYDVDQPDLDKATVLIPVAKGRNIIVDSITALEALTGTTDGQVIKTKGYYAGVPLDMPDYVVDISSTDTPNGGSVIARPEGGNFVWQEVDVINVACFGADPTGVLESYSSIQNAINTLTPLIIPYGTFKLSTGLTATHEVDIQFYGKLKYEGSTPNTVMIDITTDGNDLNFTKSPILRDVNLQANANVEYGVRFNSVYAPKIINYTARGFSAGWPLAFRNIRLNVGAPPEDPVIGWNEGYVIENFESNFNRYGIKFYVDDVNPGTTSFAYGSIKGKITLATGDISNQSVAVLVETVQLYGCTLDLTIWCNDYGTAIQVGSPAYPNAILYWCFFDIRGEQTGALDIENYAFDLTDGEVIGCSGFAYLNMGQNKNPSNNRLEIYGQYQKVGYGTTTKQINGVDTILTPLVANFQVEDFSSGFPEGGFGLSRGTNVMNPVIWMRSGAGNSFVVCSADEDTEPDTDDPLMNVTNDGQVLAKSKHKAPLFATYEEVFNAAPSTTTTQQFDLNAILGADGAKGAFYVTCTGTGANTNLAVNGIVIYSDLSQDIIVPVTTLATQDYNLGSIALQTYNNIAANTFSAGNGRKFQIVVTNDNVIEMPMNLTITRIG